MENNNKAVVLGEVLPKSHLEEHEVEMIEGGGFTPTSKYMPQENTLDTYGKGALFLSELEREVAINVAEGIRYKPLAKMLDLDERVVKVIANRKHVRKFITEYVEETTAVIKAKREQYLSQIIEAKLDRIENMADASDLDIATLLGMLDSMQKEKEKAELQKTNSNQIVNVLQMITKD